MPPVGPETFISIVYLAAGALLVLLGLPLYFGWIPPNRFYGFRTRRTLAEPLVWYAVNRVTGGWMVLTGSAIAAAVVVTTYFRFSLSATAVANLLVFLLGMAMLVAHSLRTLWRMH